jgi:nuclear pore complex protein Nup62
MRHHVSVKYILLCCISPPSTALFSNVTKPATPSTLANTTTTTNPTAALTTSALAPTSTSTVVSVAPPSMLRGKSIEEIVNRWSSDLETHVRHFTKYASEIAVWDRALIENGNNVRIN